MPELSILIPCLNEAASIGACLEKATSFLSTNNIDGEIIVVDNGSEDGSAAIAKQYKVVIVSEPQKGYGNAINSGINKSAGKYIIMGDADDSYDFSAIMPFLTLLRQGYDIVIGNRFKGSIRKGAMPFLHRYVGNPLLSFAGRIFFRIRIGDFHCGLRGFSKSCYEQLELRTTGMEFASEMIVKAAMLKMKITETPVVLYPDKRNKPSHLRTWRDGWRHLRFLLLYSPGWLFLIPGIALMILGLISSVSLVIGPITIGGKKFHIHTLMYTSGFVLLGFQFISLYIFTKFYTATHGLIPHQQKFIDWFSRHFKLERGIILGTILLVAGIFLNIKSFLYWKNTGFGDLNPVKVLRWVIPSVTLMLLGVQIIISCFYLSILAIKITGSEKNINK
ncbi:MAG TPA: glycosyltransferase [Chitinophagaceae bacterium]|nr:glycosyltransferase [Chitinophagaceae bacterium]